VWTPRLDGYPPLIRRKLVSVDFVPTRFNVESATLNTSGPTLHHLGSSMADRAMFLLFLHGRRPYQVQNQGLRTSGIDVHRPNLCQRHHRHCNLDKFSCVFRFFS